MSSPSTGHVENYTFKLENSGSPPILKKYLSRTYPGVQGWGAGRYHLSEEKRRGDGVRECGRGKGGAEIGM